MMPYSILFPFARPPCTRSPVARWKYLPCATSDASAVSAVRSTRVEPPYSTLLTYGLLAIGPKPPHFELRSDPLGRGASDGNRLASGGIVGLHIRDRGDRHLGQVIVCRAVWDDRLGSRCRRDRLRLRVDVLGAAHCARHAENRHVLSDIVRHKISRGRGVEDRLARAIVIALGDCRAGGAGHGDIVPAVVGHGARDLVAVDICRLGREDLGRHGVRIAGVGIVSAGALDPLAALEVEVLPGLDVRSHRSVCSQVDEGVAAIDDLVDVLIRHFNFSLISDYGGVSSRRIGCLVKWYLLDCNIS